jgi:transposase InsO family protein
MSHTPDAQLAIDALKIAVAARQRRCMDQVVFYCDRGTHDTSQAFHAACARLGVAQSMSPTGSCFKQRRGPEPVGHPQSRARHPRGLPNRRKAPTSIFAWIHRYNTRRLHSSLGSLPPLEYQAHHGVTAPASFPLAA